MTTSIGFTFTNDITESGIIRLFQPSIVLHKETNHLICTVNQITGFYMKCNNGMK